MDYTQNKLNEEIRLAKIKLRQTRCQCCNMTADNDDFGEFSYGKWWCYEHVDKLYASAGVDNLHQLIKKREED